MNELSGTLLSGGEGRERKDPGLPASAGMDRGST